MASINSSYSLKGIDEIIHGNIIKPIIIIMIKEHHNIWPKQTR